MTRIFTQRIDWISISSISNKGHYYYCDVAACSWAVLQLLAGMIGV
jgi:hypothetical protein